MNLNSPVTVVPNPVKRKDGSVKNIRPIKLSSLKFVILDDPFRKVCEVRITPFPIPLVLWKGSDYDNAGDYTQAQLETKLSELLGNDPASILKDLMPKYDIVVQ